MKNVASTKNEILLFLISPNFTIDKPNKIKETEPSTERNPINKIFKCITKCGGGKASVVLWKYLNEVSNTNPLMAAPKPRKDAK